MATAAPDTGTACAIVFGTSTFAARITSINVDGPEFPKIDTTYLGTTVARTSIRGDLYDPKGMTMDIQYPATTLLTAAIATASETITITAPGGGTLINTGFISKYGSIKFETETLMTAQIVVEFTGAFSGTLCA